MSIEKKIEIPAMPEKYRLMLEMLPEEPAGSKVGEVQERAAGRRMRMVQPDPGAGQQRRREGGMDAAGHGRRAHAPHAQPAPADGQDRDGVHRGVRG